MTGFASADGFNPLFVPGAVAVVGASASGDGVANRFLRNLRALEFPGAVFVVHPKAESIEGYTAYPTLSALPQPVDYAYISVAAERTPELFAGAQGKVRFAQVISSGFGEVGNHDLQERLVQACRAAGTRLLGPNCIGTHSVAGRISFHAKPVGFRPGSVGVISQSGGLSTDVLTRGRMRGLRFHSVVSVGNSADIGPVDLLDFMLDAPDISVIGLYLEDIAEGRAFFELLRRAQARKPVVILKGGRTSAGQRASMSHTGALMGDDRIWDALSRQTGAVLVDNLDRFVNALLVFQSARPRGDRATRNVALFGNGGGTSVLAADAFSRAGFDVPALAPDAIAALEALQLPPGTSIANPIDAPGTTLRQESGRIGVDILKSVLRDPEIDLIVTHINMSVMLGYRDPEIVPNLVRGAVALKRATAHPAHFALVLRSGGEADVEQPRAQLRELAQDLGIAVFDELEETASAFASMATHERFACSRAEGAGHGD